MSLRICNFFILLVIFGFLNANYAYAAGKKVEARGKSVLLMDVDSGRVLYNEAGNELRYPASLTKMMTIYMLLELVKNTNVKLDHELVATKAAEKMPNTKLGMKSGEKIKIEDAIKALIVHSANDVATVVAENLGGTEDIFAQMMTLKAKQLGMKNTQFKNASGLPHKEQYSTGYDMALLARALQNNFPEYYHFFNTRKFSWKGKKYKTHNKLMTNYPGVDGLKTGYIRAAGFHLASSYRSPDGDKRLVAVYMGADKPKERRMVLAELLDHAEDGKLKKFEKKRRKMGNYRVAGVR
jgi:D-alanyl-D-alanine carboxypeptidase